jgi:hypothetical protein
MLLNNPKKFTPSGKANPLIGLQDIVIKYSPLLNPEITNETQWTDVKNYNPDEAYNWIKMSFDSGETWSFIYKLNTSSISFNFSINNLTEDVNNLDYPYYYRHTVETKSVYDSIKNKPLSLFIGTEDETISFSAPIRYKTEGTKYYIDILFTASFKTQFNNCTCYINN